MRIFIRISISDYRCGDNKLFAFVFILPFYLTQIKIERRLAWDGNTMYYQEQQIDASARSKFLAEQNNPKANIFHIWLKCVLCHRCDCAAQTVISSVIESLTCCPQRTDCLPILFSRTHTHTFDKNVRQKIKEYRKKHRSNIQLSLLCIYVHDGKRSQPKCTNEQRRLTMIFALAIIVSIITLVN